MADRTTHYPPDALLTPDEVCEWLDITENTLRQLGIRRVVVTKRNILYFAEDVYDWLKDRAA